MGGQGFWAKKLCAALASACPVGGNHRLGLESRHDLEVAEDLPGGRLALGPLRPALCATLSAFFPSRFTPTRSFQESRQSSQSRLNSFLNPTPIVSQVNLRPLYVEKILEIW